MPKCKKENAVDDRDSSLEKFDHREFGLERQFFCSPKQGGAGLPFWLPNGYKLTEIVRNYVNDFQEKVCGIKLVKTPVLGKKELYCKTGHLPLYSENIFPSISEDEEEYVLRPMTCPHHILLAKEVVKGYRQLPYLVGENSILHRREYSGGLLGLKRVRSMELIDTHIFLMPEQAEQLIENCLNWVWTLLRKFQVEIKEIVLATKSDKGKYLLENEEWLKAESVLFGCAKCWSKKLNLDSKLVIREGDAAFYGPKIDFNAADLSRQTFTISTIQLDTWMSKKLEFNVSDSTQKLFSPWIIHLGLIGTLERFTAYLLERWRGRLPFWLSPVQITIIPIDCVKFADAAWSLHQRLIQSGFRSEVELGKDRFSRKIFDSAQNKIPIQVLIGSMESENADLVSFRELGSKEVKMLDFSKFVDYLTELSQKD